jgi:hypothetical protein
MFSNQQRFYTPIQAPSDNWNRWSAEQRAIFQEAISALGNPAAWTKSEGAGRSASYSQRGLSVSVYCQTIKGVQSRRFSASRGGHQIEIRDGGIVSAMLEKIFAKKKQLSFSFCSGLTLAQSLQYASSRSR